MRKAKKEKMPQVLAEATCPVCEKTFFPAAQHVYRDKRSPYKKVCSWGCVCASERLKEKARAKNES